MVNVKRKWDEFDNLSLKNNDRNQRHGMVKVDIRDVAGIPLLLLSSR